MTDRVNAAARSKMMAAVRGADTAPELFVRKALFRAGFRFRLHAKGLPGKPDIVLPKHKTVVFVHGCFWHGHRCRRGKRPATNQDFWNTKIDGNIRRDRRDRSRLTALGWRTVVIWQCNLERSTDRLLQLLKEASGAARP